MTIPLGESSLFFRFGLGSDREKKIMGSEICAQGLSTKVRGWAKTRQTRAGLQAGPTGRAYRSNYMIDYYNQNF